ncbi:hypothetical protein NliqN6_4990 [Naganishia liquefaciens]|uniref:Tr-type G domain-containing protein n=1 Tax=Naganishia liquefaciens TaxID=104408 RepID=A0A8H3TWW9_9TREE|nr:hypothetical protein NliqN6_4990 [Naganishia liquefaciens]
MTASTASGHTSLKAFQAEIDKVKSDAQKARHEHELRIAAEQASSHGNKKHAPKPSHAQLEKEKAAKAQVKEPVKKADGETGEAVDTVRHEEHPEMEETIEDILFVNLASNANAEDDPLRSKLGHVLLHNHGEYVLALGYHPAPEERLAVQEGPASVVPSGRGRKIATRAELDNLLARLRLNAKAVNAELFELYVNEEPGNPNGIYGCWMLRWTPKSAEEIVEVRVAVVGNVDAGKSTMLGVLTRGSLDDGRGKARVALFRHKHEVETGRTSSVGMEILGFSPKGDAVVPTGHAASVDIQHLTTAKREKMSWDEICSKSSKVVSFIDLAGHERYLKTTLFGLTGCSPDYVMLIVGGNAGLIGMSKEHLGVALALHVPVIICVTKIDMTPAHVLEQTVKQLNKVLKSQGVRKVPVWVDSQEQAVECARNMRDAKVCPVFMVSNVTGKNLPYLRTLLNCLKTSQGSERYTTEGSFEFSISDCFSVPFVGAVASGIINTGKVHIGDPVVLGPDSVGQFTPTTIKSIQRKRVDVESAEAGQSVSFALKRIRRNQLRKGMVIIAANAPPPKAVKRFEAQMLILYHNSTIQPKYQAMCHVNSIRQTVRVVSIDHPTGVLRTGDRAKMTFEFIQQPEFLLEGSRLIVRESRSKLLGVVTRLLD